MTQLKIGDRVRDNDPRMPERVETVLALETVKRTKLAGSRTIKIDTDTAIVGLPGDRTGRVTRIRLNRIHLDDKPRRSGWSRVR